LNDNYVILTIHFDKPPSNWQNLLEPFQNIVNISPNKNKLRVHISGTFKNISDSEKEYLFQNNYTLEYVHDTISDLCCIKSDTKDTITELAEYGFCIPFVWYVDKLNIANILSLIDEALFLNYNSGFLLPCVDENIFISETQKQKNIPSKTEYIELLIDTYEKYPYYDQMLYPLNIFLHQSLPSGWVNPIQRYNYDPLLNQMTLYLSSPFFNEVEDFFIRSFLWQRWYAYQENLSTAKTDAC
jgi:hypothetical protein